MSDYFLSLGHYEDLKHNKEELESSLKRYRRCTSALKDENERLKVCSHTSLHYTHSILSLHFPPLSVSLSLPPSPSPSLSFSLSPSLSLPPSPSLPLSLSPSLPPSLPPLSLSLSCSLSASLPPSLSTSPSLSPPSLPPSSLSDKNTRARAPQLAIS